MSSGSVLIKKLLPYLKLLVPLVVAFFVGRVIHANWQQVREAEWSASPLDLTLAFLCCSAWFWVRPYGWMLILGSFGRGVPYPAVYRVFRKAEMSRMVPGAIWQFVSRVFLLKRWGVTAGACLAATVIDMLLTALASLVPAAWTLRGAVAEFKLYHRIALACFPLASLLFVHPRMLNAWAGFLAHRLGQAWTPIKIGWGKLTGIWGLYVVGWVLMAAGTAYFAAGVLPAAGSQKAYIGSSYVVAWLIGTLTMIAPGGMGIREGALGLLLSRVMPAGPAFTLAVGIRFWLLLIELIWYGAAYLLPPAEPPDEDEPPRA